MNPITSEIALCPACGHVLRHITLDESVCDECGLTTLPLPIDQEQTP